jgi:hypothetical protein
MKVQKLRDVAGGVGKARKLGSSGALRGVVLQRPSESYATVHSFTKPLVLQTHK